MASSRGTQNGPDVTDVAVLMLALQELHGVYVTVTLCPDGAFGSGGLLLAALAMLQKPLSGGALPSVSRSVPFPNNGSRTLEGAVFKLLHELDMDCSTMWRQETFIPKA